jgi:hypothetical protein
VANIPAVTPKPSGPLNVLVIYDPEWLQVRSVEQHVRSFSLYSSNRVSYVPTAHETDYSPDMTCFDAVVIHSSVRLCYPDALPQDWAEAVRDFPGLKVAFLLDEHEHERSEATCNAIEDLGVQVIYTCLSAASVREAYPTERFPFVEFLPALPAYVPPDLERAPPPRPLGERRATLGYRARTGGYWYDEGRREPLEVGRRMKALCEQFRVSCHMAWESAVSMSDDDRIEFLNNCRATLDTGGTSSPPGLNRRQRCQIEEELLRYPKAKYEELEARYLRANQERALRHELTLEMFEAIACRTALVLPEGRYSDVLTPEVHYIPLKKDGSNARAVLERLRDDACLERMTERAYRDIVASGRYGYPAFVQEFDKVLRARLGRGAPPSRGGAPAVEWSSADPLPLPPPAARIRVTCATSRPAVSDLRRRWENAASVVDSPLSRLPRPFRGPVSRVIGRLSVLAWRLGTVLSTRSYRRAMRRSFPGRVAATACDLIKLAILRRVHDRQIPDTVPFWISLVLRPGEVRLVSIPGERESRAPIPYEPHEWEALEEDLAAGRVRVFRWDHTRIRVGVRFATSRWSVHGDQFITPNWVYDFDALRELGRRDPAGVVALVRYAAGVDPEAKDVPAPTTAPEAVVVDGETTEERGRLNSYS